MTSAERAALRTMAWAAAGCAAALPLLLVPKPDDPLVLVTVHLTLLVIFGAALTFALAFLADDPWFGGWGGSRRIRMVTTWAWLIVLVTGATGIVTLASSAALRYDPSLQFLQALSSLDIAWAGAAIVLGTRRRFGHRAAVVAATALIVVCVWSIWRYLDVVGFGVDGAWIVDGGRLMSLVLPYDMGAAAVAVIMLALGIRTRQSSE